MRKLCAALAVSLACLAGGPAAADDRLILLFSKNCDRCDGGFGEVVGRQSGAATLVVLERWGEYLVSRHLFRATYGKREGAKEYEGDMRTPDGLYRTVEIHLHPGDDRFGELSVLLDYPNQDDVRSGRTGSFISLHGGRERPTLGCVRVLDPEAQATSPSTVHRRGIADVVRWVYMYGGRVPFLSVPRAHASCLPPPGLAVSRECAQAINELLATPAVSREVVTQRLLTLAPSRPLLASAARVPPPVAPPATARSAAPPAPAAPSAAAARAAEPALAVLSASASSAARSCRRAACAASHAVDGDDATAWCEGAAGDGVGERLELALDGKRRIARVEVKNGYWRGGARSAAWQANGRAAALRVSAGGRTVTCAPGSDPTRVTCDLGGVTADRVTLGIAAAMAGRRFRDTCLSEVRVIGVP